MSMEHPVETLNELLKGEQMALNIYGLAQHWQEDDQLAQMFNRFHNDHKRHAELLSNRIIELGGKPQIGTGISGVMAQISARINSFRGPEHLLKQVYDGEDKGVHAYEDRIHGLDTVSQELVEKIMSEDHDHLKYFKTRFEEEKAEKH